LKPLESELEALGPLADAEAEDGLGDAATKEEVINEEM